MPDTLNRLKRLRRKIRNRTEKAILDFNMIQHGDRILLGISGGADSLSLLEFFSHGFPHVKQEFSFIAVHVDTGLNRFREKLENHFQSLNVDYRIEHTNIARKALDPHARKNPCFICSMYRRRKIYKIAAEEKCNKIAYGHHKDDMIETLLLNILFGRKIEVMSPVQPVFKGNLHIIRPFTYIDESLVKQFAKEAVLPVLPRTCPVEGLSRRDRIRKLIRELQREETNANIRENIFKSFYHVNMDFTRRIEQG
jgi:tRNA 2-thiocytidine biosynthesis protein TtcA